jgi:hypothetical protein
MKRYKAFNMIVGTLLVGCNIIPTPHLNSPPIADAGPSQDVPVGSRARLDATGSTDPNGDPLTFAWSQTSGERVQIENRYSPEASFLPPAPGRYEFAVTVSDGIQSDRATVTINCQAEQSDSSPYADAGIDFTVAEGQSAKLTAAQSIDPNGDGLRYRWEILEGSGVSLSNVFAMEPTFVAPQVEFDDQLVFQLTVTNEQNVSDSDRVIVTVVNIDEPIDHCAEDGLYDNGICNENCPQPDPDCMCFADPDCDDGLFCNGSESCEHGTCVAGAPPCATDETCNEDLENCEPSAQPYVYRIGGNLSGFELDATSHELTVKTGEAITGTIDVETFNTMPASSVAPLAAVAAWGDRQTQFWTESGSVTPGVATYTITVNETAPLNPGDYYILAAFAGELTAAQVVSATNWNCPNNPVWFDGNDIGFDWTDAQLQDALFDGGTIATRMNGDCQYYDVWQPATAVLVHVEEDVIPSDPGLVAHYAFDGNADDITGNGNDGTVFGATPTADPSGQAGKAYDFDGSGAYISAADNGYLDGMNTMSVAFWIKPAGAMTASSSRQDLLYKRISSTTSSWSIVYGDAAGALTFGIVGDTWQPVVGGPVFAIKCDTEFDADRWYHVAITYDEFAGGSLYIDGIQRTVTVTQDSLAGHDSMDSSGSLSIGRTPNGSHAFNGAMDDIRIYDRALDASEVQALAAP